ncbi:hypothetical protein BKA58DRAFT_137473 [Alternaria rosae]|uniref:uncharacterized protein n=1 Tax=Alternaria rosae TaxID=1187941 RepID=UPI001E8DAA16|nr:uncharacterized protein BKA58DRAFT_73885 [Alternaria rosae]XP_046028185.1 uncharacterized protein BKA58DRAFT_137473 [Alternaria rosae]KAH6845904.1 hypothetical protein BKA58DRAFT_73885 [Alternaria rosae]KAH6876211.1 hypothetical protein BKA58DRAFT_137473 [Alternaria rosae]
MPVTFGAVGDIISVVLLVKDLVAALDEARGSKAEYQAAVRELWTLDRTLLEIDLLTRQHGDGATPELRSLCETAKQAVARCNDRVSAYKKRIQGYQRTFEVGKVNRVREIGRAIGWRTGEKEALEQFRAEIAGTTSSLQMLLITANVTLLGVSRKEMNDKLDEAKRRSDTVTLSNDASLIEIKDGIENANRNIEAANSVLGNLSEALKLDWLRQLGSELKGMIRGAMTINFATYRAVMRLQTSLPSSLERSMFEEPIILDDPMGRIAPVHLQFITSWDAFHSVLELRFQDMPGQIKIGQRQYALQASGTGREIELSRPWHAAFIPGQRIDMSIIFSQDDASEISSTTCPGCLTQSKNSSDAEIECTNCQIRFRRITVIQDDESPLQEDQHTREPILRSEATDVGSQERTFYELAEREEEDVRSFKRVRLISKRKRAGRLGLFSPRIAEVEAQKLQRNRDLDKRMDLCGILDGRFPHRRSRRWNKVSKSYPILYGIGIFKYELDRPSSKFARESVLYGYH